MIVPDDLYIGLARLFKQSSHSDTPETERLQEPTPPKRTTKTRRAGLSKVVLLRCLE